METRYYIIETLEGITYNVGYVYSQKEAEAEIAERVAYDKSLGKGDTSSQYSYSTNRYDQ